MRGTKMIGRSALLLAAAAAITLLLAGTALAAPSWKFVGVGSNPTARVGDQVEFLIEVRNVGDLPAPAGPVPGADGELGTEDDFGSADNCAPGVLPPAIPENCYRVEVELPTGLSIDTAEAFNGSDTEAACVISASDVSCPFPGDGPEEQVSPIKRVLHMELRGTIGPEASGTLVTNFAVAGAGIGSDQTLRTMRILPGPPDFGFAAFDGLAKSGAQGGHFTQAGGVPYSVRNDFELYSIKNPNPSLLPFNDLWPVEPVRDVSVDLPPGLIGNPTVVERCTLRQLQNGNADLVPESLCPVASQVGTVTVRLGASVPALAGPLPVFNMAPPSGAPARFAFNVLGTVVSIDARLRSSSDYGITLETRKAPLALAVQGTNFEFWGVPGADPDHRLERACPGEVQFWEGAGDGATCPSNEAEPLPLLRMPTACTTPGDGLEWTVRADSWDDPGDVKQASFESHDPPAYPSSPEEWGDLRGPESCENVPVKGSLEAQPTSIDAETSSGLEVRVEVPNPGLESPTGIASSDLKKVEVALPRGVTINPSQAEGLGVCSPARYESTVLSFFPTPGKGCPDDSKIGSVEVKTPLLEETIPGDVYVAEQGNNPFGSLLAIYVVLAEPERGVLIKLPGRVDLEDPAHPGQIVTTFDDLPQMPFSTFDFRFREGARAPLVTPPACGTYTTEAEFTGWSSVDPVTGKVDPADVVHDDSEFEIVRGIGGGPCPPGGAPGFNPGFTAGSINPSAGSFSPFYLRLTRLDGEQNLTKFSSILPPGVSAKIAGVAKCSEAQIAAAKAQGRSGRQELAAPSCPASSQIGRTLAGAGVGSVLTYVPGRVYLAGPYNGAPLSVVAITPAVAGPFDVGVVVIRQALNLDPVTAEVRVDGERSDPIPHILKGIPLKLRDLRVYVDRPDFTINPTSCDPAQVKATLFGSFVDVFSAADDVSVARSARYQAANCSSLGFKPRFKVTLKGGTKRGQFPALRAILTPRRGDANLARAAVVLPRSAFLEQGHFGTICTRVQYAADACPAGSVYGRVKAWSPLLDEPLQGPVYLRSSNNDLPDMVLDLKGIVEIEAVGRIDSVSLGGGDFGIRSTFNRIPDAPISKVMLTMRGGKKGLIVNSRNLCASRNRAGVKLDGHNGKLRDVRPVVRPRCGKRSRGKR